MLNKFFKFLLFAVISFSYSALLKASDIKQNIKHAKLSNGLDVYVVPNHRIPAVLHAVIYKVGGMDDPIGKAGLAHYFEHLMFETTGKFTNIESTMSSIGAKFNAFTTKEYTCYYELVLKKDLSLAMEVEADRMGNFNVTQDKVDREKNIVLEERKMRYDNHPNRLLWEEMNSAFYRTGYGRSVIGWESDIKTYNQDDIAKFHDNYYHPGNAMLLIVGDMQFDEAVKLAKEKYGDIKSKPVIRHYPNHEPIHNASMALTVRSAQVKEPVLYFRYPVPLFDHIHEAFTVDLAVDILGSGKSSKLYNDLVLEKEIAVEVDAHYHGLTFTDGYIDIEIIPKSGVDLDTVERELENAINGFMSDGITSEELQSSKYRYKAAQFDNLSSLQNIAFFYGSQLALGVPLDEIDISYSKIDAVNLDDTNNKIRTIFSAKKLIGRLLPEGGNSDEGK
ncbi:M16 family metallopeptidase [Wolbachia endosymbiont of Folsomia candida]|uniref:M16 family metallopeptidase n=1 Tax=Wolbachia endosymbiont of Folsomia candida TaxID=169402 RepID=UPI000B619F81|nr:pitrilysin family protein [Wolbachia endosymbiont of Folsomia candida]APR99170.1 insulinase family protein [Wolbachia endosymbiont of Folsomia candida]